MLEAWRFLSYQWKNETLNESTKNGNFTWIGLKHKIIIMKFGEFIKTRRVILKLTQAELSNFLHITPQCLSNYENDKTKIPLSIIIDLCYYLKISINDFFNQNISNEEVTLDLNNYNIDNIYKNLAYYRGKSKLTLKELSKK